MVQRKPIERGVRCKAEHLGGTKVAFTCPQGHQVIEDLGRKSLGVKRLSETAVKLLARSWATGGVTYVCKKCTADQRRQVHMKKSADFKPE